MSRDTMADGVTPCRDAELLAARAAWARGTAVTPVAMLDSLADAMIRATRLSRAFHRPAARVPAERTTTGGVRVGWLAARERLAADDRAAMLGRLVR